MMQNVNTVIVAKSAKATASPSATIAAMTAGEVTLFDENKKPIAATANIKNNKCVFVGMKTGKDFTVTKKDGTTVTQPEIKFSAPITNKSVSSKFNAFVATVEDVVDFDFGATTIVAGNRYVIRVIYKDLYEHPGQFTHTYSVLAVVGETTQSLVDKFITTINKHDGRRCVATKTTTKLTLTALPKTDNDGLESINLFSRVVMTGVAYQSITNDKNYVTIPGIIVTTKTGTNGIGNAKQVRDAEQAARGYKTVNSRTHFPVILPDLYVDMNSTGYDELDLEWNNTYLSPDNQYIKTTPLATNIFIAKGVYAGSFLKTALDAYLA